MNTPTHSFTERIWRGWLEWTGYGEGEMPLAYCRELLTAKLLSRDARTMVEYMDAWNDGYRAGLSDARS